MDQKQPEPNNDELKVFVSSTLQAIMAGISEARTSARAQSAFGTGEWAFNPPREVAFDVAVQATKTGQTGGGLKVQVFSVGANAQKGVAHEDSRVSRIKFSVPAGFKSRS